MNKQEKTFKDNVGWDKNGQMIKNPTVVRIRDLNSSIEKIFLITDSVFSTLFFDNFNAVISFFDTLAYAFLISLLETRKLEIDAPVNFFSYFFTEESPFF